MKQWQRYLCPAARATIGPCSEANTEPCFQTRSFQPRPPSVVRRGLLAYQIVGITSPTQRASIVMV